MTNTTKFLHVGAVVGSGPAGESQVLGPIPGICSMHSMSSFFSFVVRITRSAAIARAFTQNQDNDGSAQRTYC